MNEPATSLLTDPRVIKMTFLVQLRNAKRMKISDFSFLGSYFRRRKKIIFKTGGKEGGSPTQGVPPAPYPLGVGGRGSHFLGVNIGIQFGFLFSVLSHP